MKKLSFLFIILIATCTVALAQPRSIGIRMGWGVGASYQHSIGEKNMIQVDLDIASFYAIQTTATYNWIFPITSWNKPGSWNLYAGVGLGLGYAWWGDLLALRRGHNWDSWGRHHYGIYWRPGGYKDMGCFFVGAVGMFGAEYNFKFPLQVFADFRPLIGPAFYKKDNGYWDKNGKVHSTDIYLSGLVGSAIVVGARYKF